MSYDLTQDQEWFNTRLKQEFSKLEKVISVDPNNKYHKSYWTGIYKSSNKPLEKDIEEYKGKLQSLDKTDTKYYYYSGFVKGIEIFTKLYKEWQLFKKYGKD